MKKAILSENNLAVMLDFLRRGRDNKQLLRTVKIAIFARNYTITMKQKQRTLLIILSLILSTVSNAQNFVKSLYDIKPGENFPAEMKRAYTFIDKTTSSLLMYSFIPGGGSTGMASYEFEVREKQPLKFDLPYTGGMVLEFYDYKTKQPANKERFYIDYTFFYQKYESEFEYNAGLFSPESYFKLAIQVNSLSYSNVTYEILTNMVAGKPKERYEKFIDALNDAYKLKPALPKDYAATPKFRNSSFYENAAYLAQLIAERFDEKTPEVLFNTFVKDKSDEKTIANIQKMFIEDIVEKVDDVLTQQVKFKMNKSCFLRVPEKYITLAEAKQLFPADVVNVRLDFKNLDLILEINCNKAQKMVLKKATTPDIIHSSTKEVENKAITSDKITIVISENSSKMIIEEFQHGPLYEMSINK